MKWHPEAVDRVPYVRVLYTYEVVCIGVGNKCESRLTHVVGVKQFKGGKKTTTTTIITTVVLTPHFKHAVEPSGPTTGRTLVITG